MIPVNTILETYPTHLQGEAWLYAHNHNGKLPSLPALLRHYGKPNTVGRADVEKLDVTLLSKLYATVITDDQPDVLDASYACHCRLAKLVGEPVVRDLALGYSIRQTAERNGIHRNTINNAVKRIRQDF